MKAKRLLRPSKKLACGSPGGKERKAAETDVHAAGFGIKIGRLRLSDASQVFFGSL